MAFLKFNHTNLFFTNEKYIFLFYLVLISFFDSVSSQSFLSLFLASIITVSSVLYEFYIPKYKNFPLFKIILLFKERYFLLMNVFFICTLFYTHEKTSYEQGFFDGIKIMGFALLLMENMNSKIFKFLFYLSIYLIFMNFFESSLEFIIVTIIMFICYSFHLSWELQEKRKKLKTKIIGPEPVKISDETQAFLNLAFRDSFEQIFILSNNLQLHYMGEILVEELENKKQTAKNFLEEIKKYKYKLKKEFAGKGFSENEVMLEILGPNKFDNFNLNFEDLIRIIFSDKHKKVFFIVECEMTEKNYQVIYIMKENGQAFFKFKKKTFETFLEEKNEVIQNYSKTISFVSHEFRTPLNCIINMLQSLQQHLENDLINIFIIPSLISSKFLLNLVNDLLDIAQMEAGKFKINLVDFNIHALLEDTLQIISFQATNRGIDLKLNINNDIVMVKSDPNRIRQIVTNLLS